MHGIGTGATVFMVRGDIIFLMCALMRGMSISIPSVWGFLMCAWVRGMSISIPSVWGFLMCAWMRDMSISIPIVWGTSVYVPSVGFRGE